jgi:hypothetical protein
LRRLLAPALAAAVVSLLAAEPAAAEFGEPVSVTAQAPATVAAGAPFPLTVDVSAEAGALDIAAQPLRLRVRFAPECGGSFAGTEGPTAIDQALPAPRPGALYAETVSTRAKIGTLGPQTVCAFLEDSQERQFATDTEGTLTVIPPCPVAKRSMGRLKRRLAASGRRLRALRHRRRRARGTQRRRLARRLRAASHQAQQACRSGARASVAAPAANLPPGVPQIKHLFVIVLENENAETTFGPESPAPYLGTTLRRSGAFIPNYYGIGHESLDNYIAMVSGQPPNLQTQADCPVFSEMLPGVVREDGVAVGQGCVYPRSVQTVANQLENSGQSWRGYMQDMASAAASGEPASCRHPAIGAPVPTQKARTEDQYAARHNPFVYFHSIIDYATCQRNDVDLDQLRADLASESTTPAYSFISPDLCSDGHDATCADPALPGGYAGIEAFLREWVPRIRESAAYRDQGAILVTFDESASGADSCCGETTGPNTPNNGGPDLGDGGGRVGAVMISPCIAPGTFTQTAYNHYSLLRWSEDDFGLAHLANAAANGLEPFGTDVFTRPGCESQPANGADGEPGAGGGDRLWVRLKVRPRRVLAGSKRLYRFRLLGNDPRCIRNARIRFAGGGARTNGRGRARMRLRISQPGRRFAYADPRKCPRARAAVRILRRR